MKKFVGKINGKTYSNENDFLKALSEVQSNNFDGNLSVSSYYEEIEDDVKKIDKKDERYIDWKTLIPNSKYEIPETFKEDIKHVSSQNYKDVLNFINYEYEDKNKYIKELKDKELDYVDKISKYEKCLKTIKNELEIAFKDHNYYNSLLKLMNEKDSCKEQKCNGECNGDCACNKKCDVPSKDTSETTYKYDIDSLVNDFNEFLKTIDFWKK